MISLIVCIILTLLVLWLFIDTGNVTAENAWNGAISDALGFSTAVSIILALIVLGIIWGLRHWLTRPKK